MNSSVVPLFGIRIEPEDTQVWGGLEFMGS